MIFLSLWQIYAGYIKGFVHVLHERTYDRQELEKEFRGISHVERDGDVYIVIEV